MHSPNLTPIQRALLAKLVTGDKIRRRWHERIGCYFDAQSSAGAELNGIDYGLGGKRGLTLNTLKNGYLEYNDAGLGSWTRTAKEFAPATVAPNA